MRHGDPGHALIPRHGSGLMLLGHRYYDSSTGRFITRDPAKDGRNWYVYCAGSPLLQFDATGLMTFSVTASIAPSLFPASYLVSIQADDGHAWIYILNERSGKEMTFGSWPADEDVPGSGGSTINAEIGRAGKASRTFRIASLEELPIPQVTLSWDLRSENCVDYAADFWRMSFGEYLLGNIPLTIDEWFDTPQELMAGIYVKNLVSPTGVSLPWEQLPDGVRR